VYAHALLSLLENLSIGEEKIMSRSLIIAIIEVIVR